MQVTFLKSIEAVFFSSVLIVIIALTVNYVYHTDKLESPTKPMELALWDRREQEETAAAIANIDPGPSGDHLKELGFEPKPSEALLPRDTSRGIYKATNLLNFLHYYYFFDDEERILEESVEFVDRDTGYIKTGTKNLPKIQFGTLSKHIKYLLVLAKYRMLHPTKPIFDDDYNRMSKIVKEFFDNPQGGVQYDVDAYFDLIELYEITGDERFSQYADTIDASGRWAQKGEGYAMQIQNKSPRTISPIYMNSVVILQLMANRGKALKAHSASVLLNGIVDDTYSQAHRMFYTSSSVARQGNIGGSAIDKFYTIEQAVALRKMMEYYEITGDDKTKSLIDEIVQWITIYNSDLIDIDNLGFYTSFSEGSSVHKEGKKRADVNLLMYRALRYYMLYDSGIKNFVRAFSDVITNYIYDEEYNGFYTSYSPAWEPQQTDGIYALSISDALIGAQVFLDGEEVQLKLNARAIAPRITPKITTGG